MRRFFETKIKAFTVALICLSFFASGHFEISLAADATASVDSLRQQQQQLADKLAGLQKQIAQYGQLLDKNRKSQDSLKNQISAYDNEINSTELQIQAKQTEIDDANLQIAAIKVEIDQKKAEIESNKKVLGRLIIQLNELDGNSALNIGLGNGNFSDFLDQVQYNHSIQDNVYQLLKRIQEIKAKLESQEKDLENQLQKLQELQQQLQITEESVQSQRHQKQGLLDQTRGLERNYQKLKAASQADEAKIQQEMNDLDNSIRAKLGQRTIRPVVGALACPMQGRITQGYGNTGFTSLGYNFHNGLDVAAPAGTPIYAPGNGSVVGADTGDAAYGNWVAIKHTIQSSSGTRQVVSLLGHMRSFKVNTGQVVSQGDLIGYEGNTGNTTRLIYGPEFGYHVHISVFDAEGFGIAAGKYPNVYGPYTVPYGYTYDPRQFMSC